MVEKTSVLLTILGKVKVSTLSQKTEHWQFLIVKWLILVHELVVIGWITRSCVVRYVYFHVR
jgi:uncharacterized membrane protein YsdA (DUF1294 family)